MKVIFLLIGHWYLSLFCQSFFLHRYCSHKMFKMSKLWEKFFYLLTYLCQGASFLNPISYTLMHQKHHMHSDNVMDPHSPHQNEGIVSMMLNTYDYYNKLITSFKKMNKLQKDEIGPSWKFIDNLGLSSFNIILWTVIYIGIYSFLKVDIWFYLLIPLHLFMGPIQGAIVNWFGHKLGYRNFETDDKSRNTLHIDIFLMGELYQNNHHRYGHHLNFAKKWFEIDLTYLLSIVLIKLNVIKTVENS